MRRLLSLLAVAGLAALACDQAPTSSGAPEGTDASKEATGPLSAATSSSAMTNSRAPFQPWRQGFEHDTEGWVSQADPGPFGWCGTIERVDRREGDLRPSAGRGYAVLEHGACNDFYQPFFPDGSAPASADPELFSSVFPTGGYVNQVDVYLDPAWEDGTGFGYAVSFQVLDEDFPNFRYFFLPVSKTEGTLSVADREITTAGWYTFRHSFTSDDGELAVEFELARDGRTLVSRETGETLLTGETASDFEASETSNGYIWFVSISDGLGLAIDENRIRRGR